MSAEGDAYRRVIRKGLNLKSSSTGTSAKRKQPLKPPSPHTEVSVSRDPQPEPTTPPEEMTDADEESQIVNKVLKMDQMTPAEKSFYVAKLRRQRERVEKRTALTHREKMSRLNEHLSKLSEHFDIPKVGPG